MTEVKMPEPFRKQGQQIAFDGCDRAQADYFLSSQLKQYGDDRAREALEMAEKLIESAGQSGSYLSKRVRALAKEIK